MYIIEYYFLFTCISVLSSEQVPKLCFEVVFVLFFVVVLIIHPNGRIGAIITKCMIQHEAKIQPLPETYTFIYLCNVKPLIRISLNL